MRFRLLVLALAMMSQDAGAERIHVPAAQHADERAPAKQTANPEKKSAASTVPLAPPKDAVDSQSKPDTQTHQGKEEGSEYWPWRIFGFRLKVTDSLLVLFTGFLFAVGAVQSGVMIKQIRLARAEFLATHRPHLGIRPRIQVCLMEQGENGWELTISIPYQIVNVGDSDATLLTIRAAHFVGWQDEALVFRQEATLVESLGERLIVGGGRSEQLYAANSRHSTKLPVAVTGGAGPAHLIFFGVVTYADKLGRERERGFARIHTFADESVNKWVTIQDPRREYDD